MAGGAKRLCSDLMEFVHAAAFLIALGSALAALASLGGAVSDELDVFAHFTPVWLAGGVVALALRLLGGADGGLTTVILASAAMAICAGLMGSDLLASGTRRRAAGSGRTLKLIQFNLWNLNRDPEGTARWIADEDADVVVLEEAIGTGARVVAALGQRYPHLAAVARPGRSATMILAKAAPSAGGELKSAAPGALVSGAWATFGTGPAAFTVVGAHYTWPLPAGRQQAQSARLAADLERFDQASLIVAGDFNSTPWSFGLRRQDARFGLARRTRALFTWPAAPFMGGRLTSPVAFLAIDQVYAGSDWQSVSVKRGPRLGSDHYPVVVVLRRAA